jgi:tetratricopeptide (TPR) repeat protein
MVTAYQNGEACVALANEHGLGRIAVAYQSMLGLMKLFLIDVRQAERLAKEAVVTSQRLGHQRAEVMGRLVLAYVLSELGAHRDSLDVLDPCQALIEKLGLEVFKPEIPQHRAEVLFQLGHSEEALRELVQAADLARQTRPGYTLAAVLGRLAFVTEDATQREAAVQEGLERLDSGSLSHNHFDFHRYAMETMLKIGAWERVEPFAAKLEAYPVGEIVPWSRYFAARGRALAAFGAGNRDEATVAQIRALHSEAAECGLMAAVPRLEEAIQQIDVAALGRPLCDP